MPDYRLVRLPASITLPRAEIRQVRLEASQAKGAWIGAGAGAGLGGVVGASAKGSSKAGGASTGALGGAFIGSFVGAVVPIFHHGKIIYER